MRFTTTVTDASGNIVASYAYDAYGNLRQAADTVGNPLLYTGSPFDATTGLIEDRARLDDLSRGRTLTESRVELSLRSLAEH